MRKFLSDARDMQKKMTKAKKGKAELTKAVIVYREKFLDYQTDILKLLRASIQNGEIKPDWRSDVKVENK